MGDSDPTGYGESPDTGDGPVGADQTGDAGTVDGAADVSLTTDEDAQREDSILRPGNEPD